MSALSHFRLAAADFTSDAHHAARQLLRRPGFSFILVATLGLGIGATVALYSVVNDLLVRPLPYAAENRIQVFWADYNWRGEEYDFVRQRTHAFESLAEFSTNDAPFHPSKDAAGSASDLPFVVSSPSLFDVLGVHPAIGRAFDDADNRPGAPPVVVISDGMWRDDLGGARDVVGHQIVLDGALVTVVGVMPKGFYFPNPEYRAWRPLQLDPMSDFYHNVGYLVVIGRTRAGAAAAAVRDDVRGLAAALGQRFTYTAAWDKTKNASSMPLHEYLLGDVRDPLLLLLGAVALLLLIACANGAALVLARTTDRTTELSLRSALGAGQWRLARQLVAESLVIAALSATVGSAIAAAGFRALVASLPLRGGFGSTVGTGWVTFATAFGLALVIGCAVSIAPVRNLLGGRFEASFGRERGERGVGRGTKRLHRAIVAGQAAFAVLLVVGATLLIRSLGRIRSLDIGMDPRNVATFTLVGAAHQATESDRQFLRDAITRVDALPGVQAAGITNRLPLRDGGFQGGVGIDDRPELSGKARPVALYRAATPEYFKSLGIRLLEGRGVDATDQAGSVPVTVVNEAFAKQMWPGQSAVGKHITSSYTGTAISRTVVGVIREAKLTTVTGPAPAAMFVPLEQHSSAQPGGVLTVRVAGNPANIIPQVRRIVAELNPQIAVTRVETMQEVVDGALAQPIQLRFFLTLFAGLALVLGGVGVYGVVSYAVERRRAEFGVRLALGASPSRVRRDVLWSGLTPVMIGVVAGIVMALGLAQVLTRFLYGVSPDDPASFGVAVGALLFAGAIATLVPAARAARTDPMAALRAD
ncbi:MAG: ADOP family duplicated permease [Gemmatimonadales bacterium]